MEIYIELTSFNDVYSDINNLEIFYKQILPFYAMKTKLYKHQSFRDFNLISSLKFYRNWLSTFAI